MNVFENIPEIEQKSFNGQIDKKLLYTRPVTDICTIYIRWRDTFDSCCMCTGLFVFACMLRRPNFTKRGNPSKWYSSSETGRPVFWMGAASAAGRTAREASTSRVITARPARHIEFGRDGALLAAHFRPDPIRRMSRERAITIKIPVPGAAHTRAGHVDTEGDYRRRRQRK